MFCREQTRKDVLDAVDDVAMMIILAPLIPVPRAQLRGLSRTYTASIE